MLFLETNRNFTNRYESQHCTQLWMKKSANPIYICTHNKLIINKEVYNISVLSTKEVNKQ